MRTDEEKGEIELLFFRRFARLSGLPLDAANAEKRRPPEPDILCKHEGEGLVAFELVEICDPRLAQMITSAQKAQAGGVSFTWTSDPSRLILSKKLRKTYETSYPIELLCYTDGRVITPPGIIIPTILPMLKSYKGMFRRVWLLGHEGGEDVLYSVWSAAITTG